ncbi:Phosphoribosylformimino-5-aminoimidazole carboxamide ribotide isomerase [Minicystis rosea]|nr:Phosphoribosylformimino-5-aminoimidazole carboxamide ribotide isomerase [Minicystis rosea]
MHVLPAIDLLDGKAVRLHQGRYDAVTVYSDDPAALAASLRGKVPILHVVDLAGARAGHVVERDLVRAVVSAFSEGGGGVQVGGGIRSIEAAEGYLALGAARVVLGTAAVRDPDLVRAVATRFPDRVVVALDAKDGKVALDGWEQVSTRTALDVARDLAGLPIAAILYTDVARDGTQVGPNFAATAELAAAASCPVLASGGVGTLDHLRALAQIPNVSGAIVGRALYEKAFTLDEAIAAAR